MDLVDAQQARRVLDRIVSATPSHQFYGKKGEEGTFGWSGAIRCS